MRLTSLLFLLIIAALIAGFLPRPLMTPDWRTPFEKALAAEDCEGIRRALDIQVITGNQPAWFEIIDIMEKKEVCGSKRNADKNYEFNAEHMHKPWTFLQRAGVSSFLGPRIEGLLNNQPYSKNPIIRASQKRFRGNFHSCAGHFSPYFSYPDYTLMAYALGHAELSTDKISLISFQQTAACAGKMLDEALLMLSVADTPEDYEIALNSAAMFTVFGNASPDVASQLIQAIEALPDEIRALNSFIISIIPLREDTYLQRTIGCAYPSTITLTGAAQCAKSAAALTAEHPQAALFAGYYALRAKRLGWADIAVADASAASNLTVECLKAVAALEEEHSQHLPDYRTYNVLWKPSDLTYEPACSYLHPPGSD